MSPYSHGNFICDCQVIHASYLYFNVPTLEEEELCIIVYNDDVLEVDQVPLDKKVGSRDFHMRITTTLDRVCTF